MTDLYGFQEKLFALQHAAELLFYDGVTVAPKESSENRARTLGIISEEIYKLKTSPEALAMLEAAKPENKEEERMIELLLKDYRNMQKLPMEEYIAYQRLLVKADDVWRRAKDASDFKLFEPVLKEIFDTHIRFAAYINPEKDVYDYWLNEYEDGLDMSICDEFFEKLKAEIVPLIKLTRERPAPGADCLKGDFPESGQRELALWLMELIGLDMGHVGLGTTEHPFTTSLGSHLDERITTHYYRDNFSYSMFSVIHEGGHALYDTNCKDEYAFTVLDQGVSMGIHESQSRFYENILGRSLEFTKYYYGKLIEIFPQLSKYSAEELWRAVNRVEPSLIRTEADEVTYSLHVMIRYEIERAVLHGELAVGDIPQKWNELYKEYLGIDVPDDKNGCLQDSHWSGGNIGYFPSYALGSAYGAQFLARMKESVAVEKALSDGDFAPINAWNREHIWQHGHLYKPGELLERVLGAKFDPSYYINYLKEKCRAVYGF